MTKQNKLMMMVIVILIKILRPNFVLLCWQDLIQRKLFLACCLELGRPKLRLNIPGFMSFLKYMS